MQAARWVSTATFFFFFFPLGSLLDRAAHQLMMRGPSMRTSMSQAPSSRRRRSRTMVMTPAGDHAVRAAAAAAAAGDDDAREILPPQPTPQCASAPVGSIMIYLTEAPGLAVMPMRVMASDSVASVKLRVQTCRGFVVGKQKLVFGGRELARNDGCIRDYGVADGNVLHLVVRVADLRRVTVVEAVQGRRFRFHVEPGRTVGHVKWRIAAVARNDPDDHVKLVLEGEELDDGHLIHDVCTTDDAVIHLLVVQRSAAAAEHVGVERRSLEVSIVAAPRDAADESLESMQPLLIQGRDFGIEPVVVNPKAVLPAVIQSLFGAVLAGLEKGNAPIMSSEGTGGAYFMQDASGREHVAVFKPVDEEPMAANNPRGLPPSTTGEGLKKGTRVGEGAFREVAAYLLDHPVDGRRSLTGSSHAAAGFAGVPPTALARCKHASFCTQTEGNHHPVHPHLRRPSMKLGSLQAFVKNRGSCEDMGPRAFPVHEVHKISVLDMRLANADRHAGNILIRGEEDDDGNGGDGRRRISLVPIDHGYCLPESFEDCTFEWLNWPQSREPFDAATVEYVGKLDAEEDMAVLRHHGWEEVPANCGRTLRVATMLLKKGVEMGLTAFDIGSIMCRETVMTESEIEGIIREAQAQAQEVDGAEEEEGFGGGGGFMRSVAAIIDRHLRDLCSRKRKQCLHA